MAVEKVMTECIRHDSNIPHTKRASDCTLRTRNDYKIKISYACNLFGILNYHLVTDTATYLMLY